MNISLFSIPKAFTGHSAIHQSNAIASWSSLPVRPEIILCGNDPGVAEAAQRFGVKHFPNIQCTDQGTPLLNDAFAQVHAQAKGSLLVYANADILLMPDFSLAVQQVAQQHSQFLMLGRRWNLDVEQPIDFQDAEWRSHLLNRLHRYGIFSGIGALDYFVFPKPLFAELPPFAVGRAGWDNWMVGEALKQKYPVVNASQVTTVIHQNHDYGHLPGQRLEAFHGSEAKHNRAFLKNHFAGSSANSTHVLAQQELSPRVSVLVSCQEQGMKPEDKATRLKHTISCLQEQSYSDFEIISDEEIGTSCITGWNTAIAKAKGEFVLFLNTESQLLPNALADWVGKINTRAGSLEMIFAGWQEDSGTSDEYTSIEPWHQLGKLLNGREGVQGLHAWSLPTIWNLLHPSSVLFRRDWLVRFGTSHGQIHGVLDNTLQPRAAVIDLVLRLSLRGAAAVYLEAPVLRCLNVAEEDSAENDTLDRSLSSETIAQDCRHILSRLFQEPHMPNWSLPLKEHAYFIVENWLEGLAEETGADRRKASPQFL